MNKEENTSKSVTEQPAVSVTEPEIESKDDDSHDVAYFRRMVARESAMLDELCDKWTKEQESLTDVSEEGQTSLLFIADTHNSIFNSYYF